MTLPAPSAALLSVALLPAVALSQVSGTINGTSNVKPISPLIYGSNDAVIPGTSDRLGGNRWSAYNWENNASNAGTDFQNQNDAYLVRNLPAAQQNAPGAAVLGTINANRTNGRGTVLTVPILGYAAADKNGGGDVINTPNYLQARFKQVAARKPGGSLSLTPDTTDDFVYTDEFVNFVKSSRGANQSILYNLDNEPDLWNQTHPRIHPGKVTYDELVSKNVAHAQAIKAVDPAAKVLGAVNYGWDGYRNLQLAPDYQQKGDFQTYYLQQMKAASDAAGTRLLDALDFHYYSEARGTNAAGQSVRVTGTDTSPGVAAARMAAPRSLWDATYIENSYIRDTLPAGDKAIRLLPRTQQLINQHYAGTGMAITEYNFGGGDHISGGIAQADALGAFGEQGLYAANWWDLGTGNRYVAAAQKMFLNYDGDGSAFGDTSIAASSSDDGSTSFYAALDSSDPGRLTIVLINKSTAAQTANLSLANLAGYTNGEAFQFNANSPVVGGVVQISDLGDFLLANPGLLNFNMAPLSVTTIALVPEPAMLAATGVAAAALVRRRRLP
jgi:hypothetical protein